MSQSKFQSVQVSRNAAAAGNWDAGRPHREHVTQLLLEAAADGAMTPIAAGRLCVLGAGNCNDLDLPTLAKTFQEIVLIDLDTAALSEALVRQGCEGRKNFTLHGACDITGVGALMETSVSSDSAAPMDDAAIDAVLQESQTWPGLPQLGTFSVVASTCVLSQLVELALSCIGEANPRSVEVAVALRARHLRLMAELLDVGRWGVLVTDFVSSDTNPSLPSTPPDQLPAALNQMLAAGNCFTALHPHNLVQALHADPWLHRHTTSHGCLQPWLWNFGPRHYAVTALPFRRLPG